MGRTLLLPDNFKEHDFLKIMKKMKHARNRLRLLAMHHIQSGKTLKEVSEIVQHNWVTVQKWLKKFKEEGFEGLYESERSGAPRKITREAENFISKKLLTLRESKTRCYIKGK